MAENAVAETVQDEEWTGGGQDMIEFDPPYVTTKIHAHSTNPRIRQAQAAAVVEYLKSFAGPVRGYPYLYVGVIVDATLARLLLEVNIKNNRKTKTKGLRKLILEMIEKTFKTIPNPIMFDLLLRLTDGQHRLEAIIASDTAQLLLFAFDVPEQVMLGNDAGIIRTFGDHLGMYNPRLTKYHSEVAKLTVLAFFFDAGEPDFVRAATNKAITSTQVDNRFKADSDLFIDAVAMGKGVAKTFLAYSREVSLLYFLASKFRPEQEVETFFAKLQGIGISSPEDPMWQLRNHINNNLPRRQEDGKTGANRRVVAREQLMAMIIAYREFVAGTHRKSYNFNSKRALLPLVKSVLEM